jgi:hypothetical protein
MSSLPSKTEYFLFEYLSHASASTSHISFAEREELVVSSPFVSNNPLNDIEVQESIYVLLIQLEVQNIDVLLYALWMDTLRDDADATIH